MVPPSAAAVNVGDLLAGDVVTELWGTTDRSSPGTHGGTTAPEAKSPMPCPVSPVPCPVSPVPCPKSPVPCSPDRR
jgi:hypothetical protein